MLRLFLTLLGCLSFCTHISGNEGGKRLLEWNREKLTSQSILNIRDIEELFAPEFVVIANGRKYDANYQNYFEFLQSFRSTIETIDYEVQEYINTESGVVMPLKATIKRLNGTIETYSVILLLKLNNSGKITHWQEVYNADHRGPSLKD